MACMTDSIFIMMGHRWPKILGHLSISRGKCQNPDIFYRGAGTKIFRDQEFRKIRRSICYYIDKDVPVSAIRAIHTYEYHVVCYSSLTKTNKYDS